MPPTAVTAELPISDREQPPHFAGRRSELAALNRRLDDMLRLGSSDGGMALITGVPGAGKTQLGKRFAAEAAERDGVEVRCLAIEPEMLLGHLDLFKAMGETLGSVDEFRQVAEIDSKVVHRGGGLGPVRGNVTREHVRHTGEFAALLRASRRTNAWQGKALLVVVDELQGVQPNGMAALRVMHQGLHGCPLLLVGIGLQHTPRVLANPADGTTGISRLGLRLRLGALSESEALEAVEQGMAALQRPIPRSCASALADESHGFPQHIHGYLAGACEAIEKHGGLETEAALAEALRTGRQRRTDYYNDRLGALALRNRAAVDAIAAKMRQTGSEELTWLNAVAAAEESKDVDGEAAVDDAIRHGVLTESEEGNLGFGIPSLYHHMRRRPEARLESAAQRSSPKPA